MRLEEGIGRERVGGSPRPEKDVRRTLRVCDAILISGKVWKIECEMRMDSTKNL